MIGMGLEILKRYGAEELILYCARDNIAAMRLYESVGFVPIDMTGVGIRSGRS